MSDEQLPKRHYRAVKRQGTHSVQLLLSDQEYAILTRACEIEQRPRANFMIYFAIAEAKRIITATDGVLPAAREEQSF